MSAKVAALTSLAPFDGTDTTRKILRIYFTVTPSGNYAGTPGDPLDFTALGDLLKSSYIPIFVQMQSVKASGASGYDYSYLPGTTVSNGTFQVLQCAGNGAPMVDIGAGAYPAAVSGDSIVGFADFLRL